VLGQIGFDNDRSVPEGQRAFDRVFQFAHISRPIVAAQGAHGLCFDTRHLAFGPRVLFQKMRQQERDVFTAFGQGRNEDGDDVQAVEQIFAELAVFYRRGQIAMRGRDNAHVDRERTVGADRANLTLLQRAQ